MATTKINAVQQFTSTADWSASGYKITNVATPVSGTDAANKSYVDSLSTGLDPKAAVRATTTGSNITLSGTQTIDTISLSAGDRVLIKDQSTASQNGIYVVASGAWSRSTDANTSALVPPGMFAFVTEGTQAATGWVLSTAAPITLGSTSLTFVQFSGAGEITNGNGIAKSGNTLSVQTVSSSRITVTAGGIDLATTTVTANSYGTSGFKVPYFTVDGYGRLTAAAEKDLFGSTTMTANYVFAGPSSGSAAAATFRALVFADMIPGLVQGATTATTPTNGQLLIGNTSNSNFSLAALTQGTGIIVTNAAGSITVAASAPLQSLSGLTYVSASFVKMTSAGTFGLDTNVYITSAGTATNFSGSLSGDVTGGQSSTAISNATVVGKLLTGYSSTTGTISTADSIVLAISKLNGNLAAATGGGVTSIAVTTANGVSGSSSGGTTPSLTITLGVITPTLVNGLTLAALSTGFTVAGGTTSKTLTVSNTLTLQGTDTSTLNIGTGGTLGTAAYTASSAYQAASSWLTSLAGLTWSSGTPLVKMTAAGTFGLDTNVYITSSGTATNFSGSLSGDVTGGQGSTAISAATVTGKLITGFSSGAGTVAATDTILQAINKLDGNTTGKQTSSTNLTSLAGLTYVSSSFVKMTGANTFTLDTNTYLTSSTGLLATGTTTGATSQAQAFTNGVKTGLLYPSSDSTTAIKITKADGTTALVTHDTTNSKVTYSGSILINTSGTSELFNTYHDPTYSVGRNIWIGGGGQSSAGTSGHTDFGADMVSLGHGAFQSATQASKGVAIGSGAANANISGGGWTVIGANSLNLLAGTTGMTVVGSLVGSSVTSSTSGGDTLIGVSVAYYATTIGYNTLIGAQTGSVAADGSTPIYTITNCTVLGANCRVSADNVTNEITIGYTAIGSGSNTVTLGNSSITKTVLQGTVTFNDGNLLLNNVAATYASKFTNTNTAARTYTLPDRALTIDNITTATTTTGTGFLKGNGSVISFDGTTYVNIAKFIIRESPAVTPNGATTAYPLANLVVAGTEQVYVNGILQRAGGNDYATSNASVTTITFQTGSIPQTGDFVQVSYISQ